VEGRVEVLGFGPFVYFGVAVLAGMIALTVITHQHRAQPVSAELPPGFSGVFHLMRPQEVDAINVEFTSQEWRWTLCGCDTWKETKGVLKVEAGGLVLLPRPGEEAFHWVASVGYHAPAVRRVDIALRPDGSLTVKGNDENGPFEHELKKGRLCAVCTPDRPLAPSGLQSCAGPVPASPCD
jgi:hypothetical protein